MKSSHIVSAVLALASSAVAVSNETYFTNLCQKVANFTGNEEAPAIVDSVNYVPYNATSDVLGHCNVSGHIDVYTGFQIVFPANISQYTNTFTSQGCGGSCGVITAQMYGDHPIFATPEKPNGEGTAPALLRRGYIASMTDMGHNNDDYPAYYDTESSGTCFTCTGDSSAIANVGSWTPFRNNRTNEIRFGYLSTHLVTVMGKELALFYYGTYPEYSYFVGGSTGGRQALVEASKYPLDYNGISAGQPPHNETYLGSILYNWLVRKNFDSAGNPILSVADAGTMNLTALASCDHLDGLVDGLIDNADLCTIDWSLITCGSPRAMFNETTCFNSTKLAVAKAMYEVPTTSDGTPLINSNIRFVPGTEAGWVNEGYVGVNKSESFLWGFSEEFNKYAAFQTDKADNWTQDSYEFDTDPFLLKFMEGNIFYSQNSDLTAFKEAGGKMLLMHSWSDPEVPVGMTLDYYGKVRNTMGGQAATDDFLRMFLMPGMWHVWAYGPGATSGQDVYSTLVDWVEHDIAPDYVMGTKYDTDGDGAFEFARPAYRFPYYALYDGVGDWTNASSWGPALRPDTSLTGYLAPAAVGFTASSGDKGQWID